MKKKRLLIHILTLCLITVIPAGCRNTAPSAEIAGPTGTVISDSPSKEPVTPAARTVVPAPTSYISDEMYANATNFANVNLARLKAVMKKAEAGEPVTVAVIGGSITQGSLASRPENCYASVFSQWWKQTFPGTEITLVNAGLGGTDSYLGVHRMDTDLLAYSPDMVIVEFSVNDADSNFCKATYENVVRRILLQDNSPAVMLLFMSQDNGTSAQTSHGFVGFYYELPRVSYHDMIMSELNNGNIAWSDISPDNIHPNDKGHAICGELIWKYLNSVYASLDEIPDGDTGVKAEPLTNDAYIHAHILDSRTLTADSSDGFEEKSVNWQQFQNGWQTTSGGKITFTVEAKRLGILYYRSVSGGYGKAEIIVDGKSVSSLNGDFSDGWGNSVSATQVFSDKETGTHTVTIIVPDGEKFDILGMLIS